MNNEPRQPQSCQADISGSFPSEGNQNFHTSTHSFKDGKCYQDGQLLGNVIFSDDKIIQVEQMNGGLADGTIRTFVRSH